MRDSDHYLHAEAALKRAGILYSDHGPHHAEISDDVLYSLRYRDDTHVTTHITHERGEHTSSAAPLTGLNPRQSRPISSRSTQLAALIGQHMLHRAPPNCGAG